MNRDRKTVLHIDDDPAILRLVKAGLTKEGYEVISLDDPMLASQKMLETDANVVLLDVDMPSVDGLTLLKQLKSQDGGVQVIMITGIVSISTVLRSMRYGAEACVFKPITDLSPLLKCLDAAFVKLDHWWNSLLTLRSLQRKADESSTESEPVAT
ncbi:MAG: response regulator [Pirellulales bacterium]|nr:response regulator [Pirellulales bacterium]